MTLKLTKFDYAGAQLETIELPLEEATFGQYGTRSHRYALVIGEHKYWIKLNGELDKI